MCVDALLKCYNIIGDDYSVGSDDGGNGGGDDNDDELNHRY